MEAVFYVFNVLSIPFNMEAFKLSDEAVLVDRLRYHAFLTSWNKITTNMLTFVKNTMSNGTTTLMKCNYILAGQDAGISTDNIMATQGEYYRILHFNIPPVFYNKVTELLADQGLKADFKRRKLQVTGSAGTVINDEVIMSQTIEEIYAFLDILKVTIPQIKAGAKKRKAMSQST